MTKSTITHLRAYHSAQFADESIHVYECLDEVGRLQAELAKANEREQKLYDEVTERNERILRQEQRIAELEAGPWVSTKIAPDQSRAVLMIDERNPSASLEPLQATVNTEFVTLRDRHGESWDWHSWTHWMPIPKLPTT